MTDDDLAALAALAAFARGDVDGYGMHHAAARVRRLLDALPWDRTPGLPPAPVTQERYNAVCAERGRLAAENERLRAGLTQQEDAIEQTLGAALRYPRYADDQATFPGATAADGVCVGEHVAETLATEAAREIARLRTLNAGLIGRCAWCAELLGRVAGRERLEVGDVARVLKLCGEGNDERGKERAVRDVPVLGP